MKIIVQCKMDLTQLHQEAKIQLLVNASLDEFNRLVKLNKEFNQLAYSNPTSERVFKERSEKYFPQFIQFRNSDKSLPIPENRRYYASENKNSVIGQVRKPMSWQEFYKRIEYLFQNIKSFSQKAIRLPDRVPYYESNVANNLIFENKLMETIVLANMPNPIHPTENSIFYSLGNANIDALNYLHTQYPQLFSPKDNEWLRNYLKSAVQSNDVETFKRAREIHPFTINPVLQFQGNSLNIVEYILQNYPKLEISYDPGREHSLIKRIKSLRGLYKDYEHLPIFRYPTVRGEELLEYKHEHDQLIKLVKLLVQYNKFPANILDF